MLGQVCVVWPAMLHVGCRCRGRGRLLDCAEQAWREVRRNYGGSSAGLKIEVDLLKGRKGCIREELAKATGCLVSDPAGACKSRMGLCRALGRVRRYTFTYN